jgi:hypothetical protein
VVSHSGTARSGMLRVGQDIAPESFNADAPMPIASRRLNEHLHRLFLRELIVIVNALQQEIARTDYRHPQSWTR